MVSSAFIRYFIILCFGTPLCASAVNIQLTQSGSPAGACTGSGVTLLSETQFDTGGSWGSGSTQIGAGTTIMACGTFTAPPNTGLFYFFASGTSGNPITFTCDTATNFTSPRFAGGSSAAFQVVSQSWIVLNGTNCTIQNTANGSGLTYNDFSTAVYMVGGSNNIIENFTISNICQHTSVADHTGCSNGGNSYAVQIAGSNLIVRNNAINDAFAGIIEIAG